MDGQTTDTTPWDISSAGFQPVELKTILNLLIFIEHNYFLISAVSILDFLASAAENKTLQVQATKQLLENQELRRQKSLTIPKVPALDMGQLFFSVSIIRHRPIQNSFQSHTGFIYEQIRNIFLFLVPGEELPFELLKTFSGAKRFLMEDQLLLALIVGPWINFMFHRFGSVSIWPDRAIITSKMPRRFKEDFSTTMVILDKTESKLFHYHGYS